MTRRTLRSTRPFATLMSLFGLVMAGCGDDGPSGPTEPSQTVSISSPTSTSVVVGDSLVLSATASAGTVSWLSRSPTVLRIGATGVVQALRPGQTWVVARAGEARDSVRLQVQPRPGGYSADEVDYFLDIALGFEFGGASEIVRRWATDITYTVLGTPTDEDVATLADVVSDVNELTMLHDLVEDTVAPAVEIHFVPESRFTQILPGAVAGNSGLFAVWWNGAQEINRAVVLVSTNVSQEFRTHLIREEVTQMLGLGKDSSQYPRSMFYQLFSLTDQFDPIDEALIEMLYRPEVQIGWDGVTLAPVLRRLTRPGAVVAPEADPVVVRAPGPSGSPGSGWGN